MPQKKQLPQFLENLRKRWQEIDIETGISLVESFFQLFTSVDDYLREIVAILQRIENRLSGVPVTAPTTPITITVPTEEGAAQLPPVEQVFDTIIQRYSSLLETGEVPPVLAQVFYGKPSFITYPSEGGTNFIDTAGTIEVDFSLGQVTLPNNEVDSIQNLTGLGADAIKSLIIYTSKESILEIESGIRMSIPAGQAVPFPNINLTKFKVVVPENTYFKFIAATQPMSIPRLLELVTKEYYTDQYREAVTVDTNGTALSIDPPVKQVLVYVDGDDVFVEFNGPIDTKSIKVPNGGSLTYPFLTESISLAAVSSSAVVYVRGLR